MNTTEVIHQITQWLTERFALTPFFLVDIKASVKGKIQVFIDGQSGVSIEDCVATSRYLEQQLETAQIVPENYVLEVSSPGMDNPFKVIQQYQKNIGKNIVITFADGSQKEATLIAVTPEILTIADLAPANPKKSKKAPPPQQYEVLFTNIKSAKKKVIF